MKKRGNSGWERVLEDSKAKAAGCLTRLLGRGRQAQLPGVPGLLQLPGVPGLPQLPGVPGLPHA